MTGSLRVSSADRVVYPDVGITKGEVVAYYASVSETMLPLMAGRPLTLQRFPKGLAGPGFMQKNRPNHYPDEIGVWEVPKRDGDVTRYPVVTQPDSIPYLANQGTITFHAWTSTIAEPWKPDWIVMDLDPFEDDAQKVRDVAEVTRQVLDTFGLVSLPVATGSKGFHLWVRLEPEIGYDEVGKACHAIGGMVVAAAPEIATGEFLKKERGGRVFVDWLRNAPNATVSVPFSLRPRPNASVAMPITWDELTDTDPDQWTLGAALDRVSEAPEFPDASFLLVDEIIAAAEDLGIDLDITFDRFGRERER